MGFLRDITDTIKDIGNIAKTSSNIMNSYKAKSIAKKAKEGILQFPAICSNSIEIDKLQCVCKALEHQYATFVQIAYTLDPTVDYQNGTDAVHNYINKFHNNIGSVGYADVINVIGNNVGKFVESYVMAEFEDNDVVLEMLVVDGASNTVISCNKIALKPYLEGFNETIVNDMLKPQIRECVDNVVQERSYMHNTAQVVNAINMVHDITNPTSETVIGKKFEFPNAIINNNDVKKANELIPTTMTLRVNALDRQGNMAQGYMEFHIGIKVTIHPVSSVEIVNNLAGAGRNKMFSFLKWTTGEISFFRDLVFNVDQIKLDAIANNSKRSDTSKWWSTLKRLKAQSNLLKRFGGKGLIPNATIVVNMEEVEIIRTKTGVDLTNVGIVKTIMDQYLLLGFVIVDSSTESVRFLFDSDTDFQVVSIDALRREKNQGAAGNEFKEMIKMMNRF